ncbi:MAG: hypothetical protein A3H98_02840 [Bacteroidetes bacterium RIFCSPLOWO2_02_FULL_36_8]|nr:MAG: hypothetical protein A3H98_02840 [Bacteroidetes bacterium RIFCSPLOWO2_02_FULL_36_8]OFY72271.1 MAG: hypothetical protein A3G23_01450 [Bacteroidetes bacterium RIFCSPLOWO2_12_FULL_37_12]
MILFTSIPLYPYTLFLHLIFCYLDPGSGSLIVQMIIASFLGGLYFLKVYWFKVKTFFQKLTGKYKEEEKE